MDDLAPQTLIDAARDCATFEREQRETIEQANLSTDQVGHSLWLNRNGHGSGFWDIYSQTTCDAYEAEQAIAIQTRDFSKREALNQTCPCPYHVCQRLSQAAKALGSLDLYVGDDGRIYS